ncbi:unnamed protein product [Paramecium sonneborni]|uniref:Uncharacterized protein n=1 Tax=Paramecium sonneborni TaxID=65129 RepID=A0A8S1N745_9CILI|nr:unnamed protein product [Paramecium sonneborni]
MNYNNQYNPFALPPDFKLVYEHGKAKQVGYQIQNQQEYCPCCNMSINKIPIGLCEDIIQLQFLGEAIPLIHQIIFNSITPNLHACWNLQYNYYIQSLLQRISFKFNGQSRK